MGVSLVDSTVAVLKTTTFSNIDGIAMDKQGRYYVAHWGGNAVHRYNHDFLQAPVSITTGLSSPADIYYNIQTDTLGIPNSGNNTVKFIGFAPVSAVATVTTPISIAIYPNPASTILLISTEQPDKTLEILYISDYSGRQVQCPTEKSGNQYQITVKDLPSGIYTVTVRVDDQEQVLRFVR
jgi:Secretion system C-terminal sorting domain